MAKRLPVYLLLPLLVAPSSVMGQTASKAWTVMIGGNLAALNLGPDYGPAWRSAWGFDLRLNVTSHVHVGLSGAAPFTWSDIINLNCADTGAGCGAGYPAPYFVLTTGSVGVQDDIGRISPFFDLGGGQLTLNGDGHTTWLLDGGAAIHLTALLDLVATYRAMRVPRPHGGNAMAQEWSIGLSVDTPPLWRRSETPEGSS